MTGAQLPRLALCAAFAIVPASLYGQSGSNAAAIPAGQNPVAATQAQEPTLTLAEAEDGARKHEPALLAQTLREQAAGKVEGERRSAYFPQIAGNLTAVEANGDTAVGAGALTTSSISTRAAGGINLMQLVTDFGRTNDLVRSASLSTKAAGQSTDALRQQILRTVDEAYYATEAAENVGRAAQAVLDYRRVSLKQLNALEQSQLKSTLDVQFAQVLVSEAELAVVRANDAVDEARAQLTAAMGDESDPAYVLVEEAAPPAPSADVSTYVAAALNDRPDLKARRLQTQSAQQFAQSEKKLSYPAVSILGAAGEVPTHDATLHNDYGAVGVNVNIPIFNGRLYSDRAAAAKLDARAEQEDADELAVRVSRDVRIAWARARDTFLQIEVAQRLADQSNEAMRLAQARYDAGLGSIVELNEAELNQASALITAAGARFDYQRAETELRYALGDLR